MRQDFSLSVEHQGGHSDWSRMTWNIVRRCVLRERLGLGAQSRLYRNTHTHTHTDTHTHTHTPEPRREASFLLGLSPSAPFAGKVQHLTVQGTVLIVVEQALRGEFEVERQYIDNWHSIFEKVLTRPIGSFRAKKEESCIGKNGPIPRAPLCSVLG